MGELEKALEKANIKDFISDDPNYLENKHDKKDIDKQKKLYSNQKNHLKDDDLITPTFKNGNKKNGSDIVSPVDFRVIVYHKPESLPAEHFKVLRSKIMYPKDGKRIKSVLITSPLESEGKTMVSCNLAVSIAQSIDPWVLLIDGDVRRPSIHKTLGLQKRKGLTDYLLTGNPLSEYLVKGFLDKMTILQAGSSIRNPAELMTSEKMGRLLKEVKERYEDRFVVIDSPPVNLAAETLVLAEQVDAVVMVVRYGMTDKNSIEEAVHKIGREKILGFVFNSFEVTPRKYTYYKKKYYYSSY